MAKVKNSKNKIPTGAFVVATKWSPLQRWQQQSTTRKVLTVCVVLVLLGAIVTLALVLLPRSNDKNVSITNQQYGVRVADDRSRALANENLSQDERISLLQASVRSELDARRYVQAEKRYEELTKLLGSRELSNSSTYLDGVELYLQLDNKTAARQALTKAEAIDNKITDPELRSEARFNTETLKNRLQ